MSEELRNSIENVCKKYVAKVSKKMDNTGLNTEIFQDDIRVVLRIFNELNSPAENSTGVDTNDYS